MTNGLGQRIGIRIKALREERSLTQRQLAHILGKSVETISNFERGTVVTSLPTLERIAQIFEVPIRAFFDESMEAVPPPPSKFTASILNSVKILSEDDQEVVAAVVAVLESQMAREKRLRQPREVPTQAEVVVEKTPATKFKKALKKKILGRMRERRQKLESD